MDGSFKAKFTLMFVTFLLQFQTTAPKSCFMRPPGAILAPGESVIATGTDQFAQTICLYYILSFFFFGDITVFFLLYTDLASFQVCGASREQRKTLVRAEEQGEIQNYEPKGERTNGLHSRNGASLLILVTCLLICFLQLKRVSALFWFLNFLNYKFKAF